MTSTVAKDSPVSLALERVNKAAQDDTSGTGQAHSDLLESIRKLTLEVEKPNETLTRHRLEVGISNHSPLLRAVSQLPG